MELSLLKTYIRDEDLSIPEHLFTDERLEVFKILKKYYSIRRI